MWVHRPICLNLRWLEMVELANHICLIVCTGVTNLLYRRTSEQLKYDWCFEQLQLRNDRPYHCRSMYLNSRSFESQNAWGHQDLVHENCMHSRAGAPSMPRIALGVEVEVEGSTHHIEGKSAAQLQEIQSVWDEPPIRYVSMFLEEVMGDHMRWKFLACTPQQLAQEGEERVGLSTSMWYRMTRGLQKYEEVRNLTLVD